MKRSGIKPGRKSLERGSTFAPAKPRKLSSRRRRFAIKPPSWRVQPGELCACGCGYPADDAHHVIYAQHLKANGLHDFLWDPRNRLPLARGCHGGHHTASRRVTRDRLRPENFEFARDLGLMWLLARTYPDPTQPRTEAAWAPPHRPSQHA